jgi:glycosyltransferase involved in cell wall biosynthesis
MKFVLASNMAESLMNFRGALLTTLVERGHDVVAVAPERQDPRIAELVDIGVRYRAVPMTRTGVSPIGDLRYLARLYRLLKEERPDAVLGYTIKPVVYLSVAAWLARVPVRAALVTGLGYAFGGDDRRQRLVASIAGLLYRAAGASATVMIFQNPDDRREFVRRGLVPERKTMQVAGSGIDLDRFPPQPPVREGPAFLLVARLIRDKGVLDFIEAARLVRARHPAARFRLLGPFDDAPGAIAQETVRWWQDEGVVEYLGTVRDVRPVFAEASVFVLPSYYREGTPRTAIEALACARPVITTDMPGCRETVIDGVNGFLVPPRDPAALAAAMLRFVDDRESIASMGAASRALACKRFDVRTVNDTILDAMGFR